MYSISHSDGMLCPLSCDRPQKEPLHGADLPNLGKENLTAAVETIRLLLFSKYLVGLSLRQTGLQLSRTLLRRCCNTV